MVSKVMLLDGNRRLGEGTQSIAQKEFQYDHSWMAGLPFASGKIPLREFGARAIRRCFTAGDQGNRIWPWDRFGFRIGKGTWDSPGEVHEPDDR
jgi:hypothetical protein